MDQPPTAARQIDIRPDGPGLTGSGLIQGGLWLLVAGLLTLLLAIVGAALEMSGGSAWIWVGGALAFVGGGAMVWFGAFRFVTFVRVSVVGDDVAIDWRSRSGVARTQRVKLHDVVEVVLTDAPNSGVRSYDLVVGMKNGQIGLNSLGVSTNHPDKVAFFGDECTRLAQFLGVPGRRESRE